MVLTPEQIAELKSQLREQVQSLPEPKRTEALAQIEAMSAEALEMMLVQQQKSSGKQKGIFRMIIDKDVPSEAIDENKSALAVLDINPVSKGHVLIIPKNPAADAKDLPTPALAMAKKLSKRIISKLKAKSAEIQTENKFGEVIINIIPIYDIPLSINSPRSKASKEELESLAQLLRHKKRKKIEKIKIEKKQAFQGEILKLKRKIP